MVWSDENLIKTLQNGRVVVMPTDTLYGIVGRAENPDTVERIYLARNRRPDKPCIVLIGDANELAKFSINLSNAQLEAIEKYWPGPVSIILDSTNENFSYLDRGTKTLAFRLPADKNLRNLLIEVGPLVAPSANTEGLQPSQNIEEARKYFGDKVDLYVDGGETTGHPSRVIKIDQMGVETILRA